HRDLAGAPDFDQRGLGFPRIVGGQIDIGAFESQLGAAAPRQVASPSHFHGTLTARDVSGQPAPGYSGTTVLHSADADRFFALLNAELLLGPQELHAVDQGK